jgi:negative regulator of sigma E activity
VNCALHQDGTDAFDERLKHTAVRRSENRLAGNDLRNEAERVMRARRVERAALSTFLVAACVMLFIAAYAAIAHAQNPSASMTIPQQPGVSVLPTIPATLPGTHA